MKLSDSQIKAIVEDVESRLKLSENGQRFSTDRKHVYYSPAEILYVPVFATGTTPAMQARMLEVFSTVEREASERFNVDVLVLPAEDLSGSNGA